MRDAWLRWFGPKSLSALRGPTRISLRARIVSPDEVTSPLTGARAALFRWTFFVRFGEAEREPSTVAMISPILASGSTRVTGRKIEVTEPLRSGAFGEDFLLERDEGTIEVPIAGLTVQADAGEHEVLRLEHELPAPFDDIHRLPLAQRGRLFFREVPLHHARQVRLTATVAPLAEGKSAYRRAGRASFAVRTDLGPTLVEG